MTASTMLGRVTRRMVLAAIAATGLTTATSIAAAQETGTLQTYRYFVFSNPVKGQETEYHRWYDGQHIGDVMTANGFKEARRYEYDANEQLFVRPDIPTMPRYLVMYTIVTDDIEGVMTEVSERVRSGKTVSSPSYDRTTSQSMLYRDTGDAFINPTPTDPAAATASKPPQDYLHFVFTAAIPGREAEFNEWYVTKHLSEAGRSPGYIASRRMELARPSRATPAPTRYVATFEIRTADFQAVSDAYKSGSKQRSHTTSLERNLTRGYTYRALGPVVTRQEILGQRASSQSSR